MLVSKFDAWTRASLLAKLARIIFDPHKIILRESSDSQLKKVVKNLNQWYKKSIGTANSVIDTTPKCQLYVCFVCLFDFLRNSLIHTSLKRTILNAYNLTMKPYFWLSKFLRKRLANSPRESTLILASVMWHKSRHESILCNWWTLQKPQPQHQNRWCASYRQGGTFLEKKNKRSHRDPHPTAITQQGRRPRPPRHLRWPAVTWPFPNGRSCDQEGVNTTLNEEVEMTSQATSFTAIFLTSGLCIVYCRLLQCLTLVYLGWGQKSEVFCLLVTTCRLQSGTVVGYRSTTTDYC